MTLSLGGSSMILGRRWRERRGYMKREAGRDAERFGESAGVAPEKLRPPPISALEEEGQCIRPFTEHQKAELYPLIVWGGWGITSPSKQLRGHPRVKIGVPDDQAQRLKVKFHPQLRHRNHLSPLRSRSLIDYNWRESQYLKQDRRH
jgi:hypothetical protein